VSSMCEFDTALELNNPGVIVIEDLALHPLYFRLARE
jgi:hypothetical protein